MVGREGKTPHPSRTVKNACRWEDCAENFPTPATLHKHVIDVHIGSAKDGGVVCLYCKWQDCRDAQSGKKFHRRYSIVSHMLVHVSLFQFCCTECGRDFKRRPDLNKHVTLCRIVAHQDEDEVSLWSKFEVAHWLCGLGIPDLGPLATQFMEQEINGRLLLTKVTQRFLKNQLGVNNPEVRRAVISAIDELRRPQSVNNGASSLLGDISPSQASTVSDFNNNRADNLAGMLSPAYSIDFGLSSPVDQPLPMTQGQCSQLGLLSTPLGGALNMDAPQAPLLDMLNDHFLEDEHGNLPALFGANRSGWLGDNKNTEGCMAPPGYPHVDVPGIDSVSMKTTSNHQQLTENFINDLTTMEGKKSRPWDIEDLPEVLGGYTQDELDHLSLSMMLLLNGIQGERNQKRTSYSSPYSPYQRQSSVSMNLSSPCKGAPIGSAGVSPPAMPPQGGNLRNWVQDSFMMSYEEYLLRNHPTLHYQPEWFQTTPTLQPLIPPPGYPFPGVQVSGPYAMAQRSVAALSDVDSTSSPGSTSIDALRSPTPDPLSDAPASPQKSPNKTISLATSNITQVTDSQPTAMGTKTLDPTDP
eukprot:Ihof_evm3s7 gene=Ihof_evmTU3s7